MTAAKPTPGPWTTLAPPRYFAVRGPDDDAICDLFPHAGHGGVGPEIARANARLIAAAPDLLDAAKDAADLLRNIREFTPADIIDACVARLRAAIAASGAEGE